MHDYIRTAVFFSLDTIKDSRLESGCMFRCIPGNMSMSRPLSLVSLVSCSEMTNGTMVLYSMHGSRLACTTIHAASVNTVSNVSIHTVVVCAVQRFDS